MSKDEKSNAIEFPVTKEQRDEAEYMANCDRLAEIQVDFEIFHDQMMADGRDVSFLNELRELMIKLDLWVEYSDDELMDPTDTDMN